MKNDYVAERNFSAYTFKIFPFAFLFHGLHSFVITCERWAVSLFVMLFICQIISISAVIYARLVIRRLHYFTCKTELHPQHHRQRNGILFSVVMEILKRMKWALSCTSFLIMQHQWCFWKLMVVVTMKMFNGISAVSHASMCCVVCICLWMGFSFQSRKKLMFRQNDSVEIFRIKIWWAQNEMSLVNVYIYIFNVCLCVQNVDPPIHLQ